MLCKDFIVECEHNVELTDFSSLFNLCHVETVNCKMQTWGCSSVHSDGRGVCLPEWIPVMKRPKMIISGEPQVLLKPMSAPAINTSTVVFTTVPFLTTHTQSNSSQILWLWIKAYEPEVYETRTVGAVSPSPDIHTHSHNDRRVCLISHKTLTHLTRRVRSAMWLAIKHCCVKKVISQ